MEFEWDVEKNEANRAKHGVSLAAAAALDWDEALDQIDDRTDYGELRVSALVPRAGRLYFCAYTQRGTAHRIISLRKANARQVKRYADQRS